VRLGFCGGARCVKGAESEVETEAEVWEVK
jgi:hypothetical protein